ncbi:MAG: hypothetical protein ACLQIB_34615 [Isosphaeraceae bacterium]
MWSLQIGPEPTGRQTVFLDRDRNAATSANCRNGRILFDVRATLGMDRLLPDNAW